MLRHCYDLELTFHFWNFFLSYAPVPLWTPSYNCTYSRKTQITHNSKNTNAMRSRLGKSAWNRTCNIFSFLFDWVLIWKGTFHWKPHLIWTSGSKVLSNWRILKTIENKRNAFLLLAVSQNQCSRLPRLIPLSHNTNSVISWCYW